MTYIKAVTHEHKGDYVGMKKTKLALWGIAALIIVGAVAFFLHSMGLFSSREQIALKRLELSLPKDSIAAIECLHESHGGFGGDGDSVFKITFSQDASKYFSSWSELPVSEEAEDCLLRSVAFLPITQKIRGLAEWYFDDAEYDEIRFNEDEGRLLLPEVEKGRWKLVGRGELEGMITDFTFCIYDEASNTAYIIESDM